MIFTNPKPRTLEINPLPVPRWLGVLITFLLASVIVGTIWLEAL